MCRLSVGGIRPLRFIPTIRSQGALGPACTKTYPSSTVPRQFLLPPEQTGTFGFVGTPQCLAPASKRLPPVLLLLHVSPVPACSVAVYFTHGRPALAHRYPAHTAAYPGFCHAHALSGLYSIHTHLPSGIPPNPPKLGRQFHAHIVLFSVVCVHAYYRLPCNYHQMLGAAMA